MITAALETLDVGSGTRRKLPRHRLNLDVASQAGDAPAQRVLVHDISTNGLLLESETELAAGEAIKVELPEAPATVARVVWSSGAFYGCQFDRPIPGAAVSASRLQSPFGPLAAPPEPEPEPDSGELPYHVERGRLPTGLRIQAVVAISVLLWLVVFRLAGLI